MKLSDSVSKGTVIKLITIVIVYVVVKKLISTIDPTINQSDLYSLLVAGLVVVGYNYFFEKKR